jgi:hypothetical protein
MKAWHALWFLWSGPGRGSGIHCSLSLWFVGQPGIKDIGLWGWVWGLRATLDWVLLKRRVVHFMDHGQSHKSSEEIRGKARSLVPSMVGHCKEVAIALFVHLSFLSFSQTCFWGTVVNAQELMSLMSLIPLGYECHVFQLCRWTCVLAEIFKKMKKWNVMVLYKF